MSENTFDPTILRQQAQTRLKIEHSLTELFAPEDTVLQKIQQQAAESGLPAISISPIQGKLLQLLAYACNARKMLEIGSLGGYSGTWLARALPPNGKLITLELEIKRAELVREAFSRAGLADRTEVKVGRALELLPTLSSEAPFDLIFIDADKRPYPEYLDWALRLTRPGSLIVADNCIRQGRGLSQSENADDNGIFTYNQRISHDPHLSALALPMDDDYTDGFAIAVVKQH